MRDAVICEPLRTPVGGFGGSLRDVPAADLAATVIRALIERTGLPPEAVDDVLLGHCYPTMDAPAIGRVAALDAGLPVTVDRPADRPALRLRPAGRALRGDAGADRRRPSVVLAGGAESMSNAPFYSTSMRWGAHRGPGSCCTTGWPAAGSTAGGKNFPVPGGMIETAENLRREYGIGRAGAGRVRRRAATSGPPPPPPSRPVRRRDRAGHRHAAARARRVVDRDEHIRPDSTVETLAKLRPIMGRDDPEATVTAGNASGQNDGAAVCIVTTPEKAAELGLTPARPARLLGRRRRAAGDDGHRPGAGHGQGARRRPG